MSKQKTPMTITDNLNEQSAVIAWRKLNPDAVALQRIDILKQKNRSFVCRLVGIGPGSTDIIAKRREREKAIVERIVYEEVLPKIGMETIRFFGFVEEGELSNKSRFAWLFLEDLGDWRYSPYSAAQRALLARWIGTFHTAAANLHFRSRLPDRGPVHHRILMQSALDLLPRILRTSSLEAADRVLLEHILKKCQCVAEQWEDIEAFCNQVPNTVIHGDCLRKNIHMQGCAKRPVIFPFDWSAAGWGPLGLDLGQTALPYREQWQDDPDVIEYWFCVKDKWPNLDIEVVQRLGHLGRLFWSLDVISWAIPEFTYTWVTREKLIANLRIYEKVLSNAVRATGWGD